MKLSELQSLIDAALEGDISEADFLRLEAELTIDPAARREYYQQVSLSMLLENEAAGFRPSVSSTDSRPASQTSWIPGRWAIGAMLAMAATLLAFTAIYGPASRRDPGVAVNAGQLRNDAAEQLDSGFAVVSGQSDAVWHDGRALADGSLVPAGELRLQSGLMQFELFSGVALVVEGEARFSILSPMEVAVAEGKVRARVPEAAHGFRIVTDAGELVDLGTEFAMKVSNDGAEVHVLNGEVQWRPRGADAQQLEQGEATRSSGDGHVESFAAAGDEFIGPEELRARLQHRQQGRLDQYRQRVEALRRDPRLLAYYRVTPAGVANRRLPNLANDTADGSGAVVAAAAAVNRWGESGSALDLSPTGSRVRVSIPGQHSSLTLACWVKINSLDRWYNSLFLTDGHELGEPHWQIMDDGRLFFSVKKYDRADRSTGLLDKHVFYSPKFWHGGLSGQWLMIATAYDVDERQVTHFVNGNPLSTEAVPAEYLVEEVRIGPASLGNWDLPMRSDPAFAVRNLNGTLDEFLLFGAALTPEEIKELYEVGKP